MSQFVVRRIGPMAVLCLLAMTGFAAETRLIRLRNQTIPPRFVKESASNQAAMAGASGLYLVQTAGPVSAEQQVQLAALGVELLQYVPEETFIARLASARLEVVRSLPFVAWVGKYRPEYKVDKSLTTAAAKSSITEQSFEVSIVIVPRASPSEIAGVQSLLSAARQQTTLRSCTILRGQVNATSLAGLGNSESVMWVEPRRPMKLFDEVSSKLVAGDGGPQQLLSQSLGYDGAGVKVAVADSGLNNGDAATMHPDLLGRTPAFFYYGTLTDAADEHSHGTHVSGIIAGNGATGEADADGALYGLGVAPGAEIIAQRIFDGVGNYEPPSGGFEQLTRDAKSAGADIGSNSWGDDTQGRYDVSAMEFDELVRDADAVASGDQPYILEFSAGNAGPGGQTIGSPAVAKNVIATGASENDRLDFLIYADGTEAMADFSSRGPCEDGRIKPDVVAPGTWISSLQSASATDQYAWSPIDPFYQYQGGTSQAGPHASGAAAVFVQFYRQHHTNATPSPALVKAALINSALDMDDSFGTDPVPNMDEGWGRIDLTPFFDPSLGFDLTDQNFPLTNGQVFSKHVIIGTIDQPLKVTLAYTDVAAFPGALSALVNDLDLEVESPDGTIYLGNQFSGGESIPNATAADVINNVEGVYVAAPTPGEYVIRVKGRHVVQDARRDTPAVDQDFALVISGEMPAPGVGTVILDRPAYRAPSQIKVTVIDTSLAGNATAPVLLRSTTETNGENVILHASGSSGVFTGLVATATGSAIPNGVLEIANGDLIEARYFDASSGVTRTATAQGDFVPPVLTGVATSTEFGKTIVTWQSSEPGTSIVRFNTNSTLSRSVTNLALSTDHSLALPNLIPGRTYFFVVISADAAGNIATNNNGGSLFSVVATIPKTALLVDEFVDNGADNVIPLSVYTNALAQAGVSFDVWNPTVVGRVPSTNDLLPYRTAIWRFNDGVFSAETLSANEQNAIRAYVNQGGSFFMASMEQLTRLANGFFRNDILHLSDFNEDVGISEASAISGDSITAGMHLTLNYGQYSNFWHDALGVPDDISDTMTVAPEAAPILLDSSTRAAAGVKYPRTGQDGGRVVFLSFPLDAVDDPGTAPNNRATLLRNIFSFLVPGYSGRGTVSFDSPAYNLPSFIMVEVGDTDLIGQGSTTATFYSTTQTNGVSATLVPTSTPGLFRGSIQLISSTNPITPGTLRAKNGDLVWADYFDASSNAIVRATSTVDTVAPGITSVLAEPDYEAAVISWTTSEDADSVVQFGESVLLGRTASDAALDTFHEILLPNLIPDKTYYYQVVSRDAAGNVTVDNNHSNFYTFHTLQPILPPWSDNMNNGGTNWTVYDADGAQSTWTLGSPTNSLGTNNAHSPPKCWGSDLDGAPLDYSETFLLSPAIYLTNGNVATLTFWHNYDFTEQSPNDIIEGGQLMIITNNASSPITLATYADISADWEQEEIDLTPYIGRVVYLVWYYQLYSLDTLPRAGWLVDDVSVTVSNVQPGTITITNNIWQASYILNGPIFRTGKGLGTVITNAPPGTYVMTYADVPYYHKPSAQTNTVASGGAINFQGNYTITDVNGNGIPDEWESQYFGSVSTNRTHYTDTDGDGMSDYAEFVAGTDPNHPLPAFSVSLQRTSASTFQLSWACAPHQLFQVLASTNLSNWTTFTPWFETTSTVATVTVPVSGAKSFFRVQSAAQNVATGLPDSLKVTAQRLPSGLVSLTWNSAAGRGYQVEGSTNGVTWAPVSTWIQATSASLTYTLPPAPPAGPYLFRVQVRP